MNTRKINGEVAQTKEACCAVATCGAKVSFPVAILDGKDGVREEFCNTIQEWGGVLPWGRFVCSVDCFITEVMFDGKGK